VWAGVRLLVIDAETTNGGRGKPHRIVSLAIVTCQNGKITDRWSAEHVNPGEPIHPRSTGFHGIEDRDVAGKPPFAAHAAAVAALLEPRPGERVVLAAHNTRFDVALLRQELGRTGRTIPDLAVLDTMDKALVRAAGVGPRSGSLADLLAALRIENRKAHNALADATATAQAACDLIGRIADAGTTDMGAIATAARSRAVRFAGPHNDDEPVEPVLTAAHLRTHVRLGAKNADRWAESVVGCAGVRCGHLADRILRAQVPPTRLRDVLLDPLRAAIRSDGLAAGNTAATATLLGAMLPLLAADGPAAWTRPWALAFAREFGPLLDPLGRCRSPLLCPDCRDDAPCPLDRWRVALGALVVGDDLADAGHAMSFLRTNGAGAGKGAWLLVRREDARLGDASARLLMRHWRDADQDARGDTVARLALDGGCLDPEVAERRAATLSAGGRPADLAAAAEVCERILAARNGSREDGWVALAARAARIGGHLARRAEEWETKPDGTKVPKRRHFPKNPRVRPPRFLRVAATP
jgi:DNA polymerase III epsilon subunit-like protein